MRKLVILVIASVLLSIPAMAQEATLKSVLGKDFLVGCAMNVDQIDGKEPKAVDIVKKNFNSIVAENCMKPENIEPEEGKFNWTDADKFVKFGNDNGLKVIGHVLIWHDQTAPWMFKNKYGELPNREEMIKRMHDYIFTVVGRYKGKVYGWDVTNECVLRTENIGVYSVKLFSARVAVAVARRACKIRFADLVAYESGKNLLLVIFRYIVYFFKLCLCFFKRGFACRLDFVAVLLKSGKEG